MIRQVLQAHGLLRQAAAPAVSGWQGLVRSFAGESTSASAPAAPTTPAAPEPSNSGPAPAPEGYVKLFIGNLAWGTTEADLQQAFGAFGAPQEVTIIKDKFTGRSRGYGFVTVPSGSADSAIIALHGKDFQGRPIRVQLSEPRDPNTPRPPRRPRRDFEDRRGEFGGRRGDMTRD